MGQPRVTIKKINERIAPLGYELVKGKGYFYYATLDYTKNPHLDDSMVCIYLLSDLTVNEWEEILINKIAETF